jgi:hypothetical protein
MTWSREPGAVWRSARGLDTRCYRKSERDGTLLDYPTRVWSAAERVEEWEFLRSYGFSIAAAAARMGITRDALTLAIRRHARRTESRAA